MNDKLIINGYEYTLEEIRVIEGALTGDGNLPRKGEV